MTSFQLASNGTSRFRFFSKSLVLGLAMLFAATPVFGGSIVVPNSMESTEGNDQNIIPFSWYNTVRYQQVYGSADFDGPGLITHIRFRPDFHPDYDIDPNWYNPNFELTNLNIQISLATTAAGPEAGPDGLSLTFADNLPEDGADVVFGGEFGGELILKREIPLPPLAPIPFGIEIELDLPFFYDPSLGNLLLDVTSMDDGAFSTSAFDMQYDEYDAVYSVWYTDYWNGTSDKASGWGSGGLVTQFEIIPEDVEPGIAEVDMDIKFCDSPNMFNCKAQGPLQLTIFGTESFNVADIDPTTLKLCLLDENGDLSTCTEAAPKSVTYNDRGDGDPLADPTDLGAESCAINPETGEEENFLNPDGHFDMDVAFEAADVKAMLGDFCDLEKGAVSGTLIIKGSTFGEEQEPLTPVPFTSVPVGDIGVDQLEKQDKLKPTKPVKLIKK